MQEGDSRRSIRIVEFADGASSDVVSIAVLTENMWGEDQADRYVKFLRGVFLKILDDPRLGDLVEGYPGYYVYLAKYNSSSNAHGHRVFYRITDRGIEIIRVLHTAMDWFEHL